MDISWDGDSGLLVLEHDRGCFLHPQGEQELLVWGQLPQGLERGEPEQGSYGLLRCTANRINRSVSQQTLTEHRLGSKHHAEH